MTPSKAILAGSGIIALSIVAAAAILPERSLPFGKETTAAGKATASRYQIVKADDHMTWRLDTRTGDITVCRLDRNRMVCASSANAVVLPKVSTDELQKQEEARREAKRAERKEVLDRFMAFFDRIIRFAEKQTDTHKSSPPPGDGQTERL